MDMGSDRGCRKKGKGKVEAKEKYPEQKKSILNRIFLLDINTYSREIDAVASIFHIGCSAFQRNCKENLIRSMMLLTKNINDFEVVIRIFAKPVADLLPPFVTFLFDVEVNNSPLHHLFHMAHNH